ncbi:hypothetical protein ACET3Z_026470 [Daucus carota]
MANSDDDFQQSAPTIFMKSKTRIKTSAKRPPENPTTDVELDDEDFCLKDLYQQDNESNSDSQNAEDMIVEEEDQPIKPKFTKWKRKANQNEDNQDADDPLNKKKPILKFQIRKGYPIETMQLTNDHLSQKLHKEYSYVPSFSLGIENDIIQQVCEDINQQEIEGTPNSQVQTPELPKRLKSTRNIKMGRYAKSPYIQRGIDITAKCTNEDLGLWRFLIQNKDPLEPLFLYNGFECIREYMQTLKLKKSVSYSVIDMWAIILNNKENYKADESPLRLFCTIGSLKTIHQRSSVFSKNMDDILTKAGRNKIDDLEMVFFPIHKYDHFYLITYHLKKTTYEIIDNIKRDEHEEIFYGEVPDMLSLQESQITKLRVKYNSAILSFPLNEKRTSILKEATDLFNKVAQKKLVNILNSSPTSRRTDTGPKEKKMVRFAKNLSSTFEEAAKKN